ncbi:hypothetical protein cypCar_00026822 [Cyprinus carpio]|nr:hypothetical protein cypCar_00026822 [Cyprinus carpio]
MGSSLGCVKQPRDAGPGGAAPLSPKRKLRFRRKRKAKQKLKGAEGEDKRSHILEEKDCGSVEVTEESTTRGPDSSKLVSGQITTETDTPTNVVLVPGMAPIFGSTGTLRGSKLAILSPDPSPAWLGALRQFEVEGLCKESHAELDQGNTTPGGGRVCKVRERVQGVLEKPCLLRSKRGDLEVEKEGGDVHGQSELMFNEPSETEKKGVVHIREFEGQLCVVRTVYPRDYGSPVWRDKELEVHSGPPAASPVTGGTMKIQVSTTQGRPPGKNYSAKPATAAARGRKGREFLLDNSAQVAEGFDPPLQDLQSSGYASDVPLTSPETGGAVQTDWGSSSDVLDSSVLESPISPQEIPAQPSTQISEIYVSGESGDLTAKEKLLLWSQQATEGYRGLRCTNFSSSWSDGRLFNALLHRYRPDLIDMEVVAQQSNRENLEQAFEIAESLGVTRLLDAEDVDVPLPDEKSVITYVSSIYDAFPKIPEGGEGIAANEVDQRWTEYQSGFSSLLQWTRQHTALMTNRSFPHNPVELKALYNEYVHFKETEIPAKEREKSHIEHLYKLLEAWIEFGRIKLPQGLHPNDLEEEWGKLILEMLEREKALRPAVERLELLLQKANKIQNMALDCEEKLTLAKNTLQADMSHLESGQPIRCENELGMYLQDCEALVRQLHLDLQVLRDEKYYQVEQLVFRVSCLQEELVSLRLQCASVYRKGHFSTGGLLGEHAGQKGSSGRLATLGAQTLLGAVGAAASLLRRPMSRADLVAMSSSEDEGSLRFIYELLGWVDETQELLERAEWGSDLPSVDQHLQDHHIIHTAVEDLLNSLKEARNYESRVSPNLSSSYSETLSKLENQYCKLLEHSSWRLRCLESLRAFVSHCTEELIWLNEREEEELAFDWSDSNTNMAAKREQYSDMRSELEEKQEVMHSLQETADQLCQENHPAKQTVEVSC